MAFENKANLKLFLDILDIFTISIILKWNVFNFDIDTSILSRCIC